MSKNALEENGKTAAGVLEAAPSHFIRNIIAEDLKINKNNGRVHTRFPPEPNGYLHIGHAKSICLNFGLAAEFGGLCNLRFDDTNPTKEDIEYVESIKSDIRWLGFDWGDREYYASDSFEQLYLYAVQLIKAGKAYVCDLSAEEIREYRGTLTEPGRNSPYRTRLVEENLDLFERTRAGALVRASVADRDMVIAFLGRIVMEKGLDVFAGEPGEGGPVEAGSRPQHHRGGQDRGQPGPARVLQRREHGQGEDGPGEGGRGHRASGPGHGGRRPERPGGEADRLPGREQQEGLAPGRAPEPDRGQRGRDRGQAQRHQGADPQRRERQVHIGEGEHAAPAQVVPPQRRPHRRSRDALPGLSGLQT